jgi:hypothetical protein
MQNLPHPNKELFDSISKLNKHNVEVTTPLVKTLLSNQPKKIKAVFEKLKTSRTLSLI